MVLKNYLLEIIVFIVGAAVMILELTGSRVLAPYLGTSIFVWTSLIGIILASLSLGYFWGGRLADMRANYRIFSLIILGGGFFVGITALTKSFVFIGIENLTGDIRLGSVVATLVLFAPASVVLGMVSPYAVRLKIKDLKKSGRTVGSLYAISTIGSIVGTFLTGFFLISILGNTKILYLLSLILIITSFFVYFQGLNKVKFVLVIFLIVATYSSWRLDRVNRESGFIDIDTQYNRIWIYNSRDEATGKLIRALRIDPLTTQSAMFLESDELVFDYTKFYRLAKHFKGDIDNSLLIGGAGYSYPKDYLEKFTESRLDVVEIDPAMTDLAKSYFRLKDNPRMTIYHEDARTFLNKTTKRYDVIFGDAFSASYSVPFQLTTREAVERLYDLLVDDGVVLVNMISSVNGETGKFLRAEYRTFKTVFPQVYLFPVKNASDGELIQNILLVALKGQTVPSFENDDEELSSYLKHLWKGKVEEDVDILTDDHAPVDQYMLSLIRP